MYVWGRVVRVSCVLFIHLWLPSSQDIHVYVYVCVYIAGDGAHRLYVTRSMLYIYIFFLLYVAGSPGSNRPFPITSTSQTSNVTMRRLPPSTWTGTNWTTFFSPLISSFHSLECVFFTFY